jgi:hypothetical protein
MLLYFLHPNLPEHSPARISMSMRSLINVLVTPLPPSALGPNMRLHRPPIEPLNIKLHRPGRHPPVQIPNSSHQQRRARSYAASLHRDQMQGSNRKLFHSD